MNKRTAIVAAALVAALGTAAAVYAQGPRQFRHGGEGPFGQMGMAGDGLDAHSGFRGRFGASVTKDDHDTRTRERFARLDINSDGFVDASEFEAALSAGHGRMRQKAGAERPQIEERLLRMFDMNKDGKVNKEEHTNGIRKLFAELDLNSDGRITDEDLPPPMRGRNVLATLGEMSGPFGRGMAMGMPGIRLLMGADANKDGVVTLEEATAVSEQRFTARDRNKDGVLDKADFEAGRKEMVDYRVKRALHHFGGSKDGRVSREQFTARAQERFAQLDFNGDGTISRDERPMGDGWHQGGMRGRWHGRSMGDDSQPHQPPHPDRR